MYDLKSVSDDYEEFLTAIGIPSFAVFFILRGSETLEMEILEDGSVQSKTITGHSLFRSDQLQVRRDNLALQFFGFYYTLGSTKRNIQVSF